MTKWPNQKIFNRLKTNRDKTEKNICNWIDVK